MKLSPTTFCGLLGAAALAVTHVPGLSPGVYTACNVLVAISVALIGYHAQDRSQKPPAAPGMTVAVILAGLIVACAGCKLGGFSLGVHNPTFGSVELGIDGGVIGHADTLKSLPPVNLRTN